MRRINFNVNTKTLSLALCLIIVCVFSLTIAYAALSAVLSISGNAEVVASSWDIHLENARVIKGSVNNNAPTINGNSLSFSAHLDVPGDYYEFVVDVVNEGTIDAMIENVIMTPELTDEQKRYLRYTVSYQNNEDISARQVLASNSVMPIRVRVEYIRDLVKGDLPTEDTVLNSSLTLEYIQSDGMGNSVANNGLALPISNGDIDTIGTVVTIGTEQFYILDSDSDSVSLLSMYNLHVGGYYNNSVWTSYGGLATGMQDSTLTKNSGITPFASDMQKGTNYGSYEGSIVEGYINNYKSLLESKFEISILGARAVTLEDLTKPEIGCDDVNRTCSGITHKWIYSTNYWTGTEFASTAAWCVSTSGGLGRNMYKIDSFGVRPVIIISKDYF